MHSLFQSRRTLKVAVLNVSKKITVQQKTLKNMLTKTLKYSIFRQKCVATSIILYIINYLVMLPSLIRRKKINYKSSFLLVFPSQNYTNYSHVCGMILQHDVWYY